MSEQKKTKDFLPAILHRTDGTLRKVGLEIEFAGMELEEAARIIQACYGGEIIKKHRYQFDIVDTRWGDFEVELDARILKKMAVNNSSRKAGMDTDEQKLMESVEDLVDKVAKTFIPLEIIMPPVAIEELEKLERLRNALQRHKAEGTKVSWVNAFGLHINIESPDLKVRTLLNYLRSFLLIYPWLLDRLEVDFSRRISPFIDPFPNAYIEMVLNVDYYPDSERFTEDYLELNSTRNRPLDMMPILATLHNETVTAAMEGEKNKPRPAFHYRLPNSRIDDPEWSFLEEWRYWLIVESLANDEEMIRRLSKLYLMRKDKILVSFNKEWAETISILLDLDEKSEA